MPPPGLLMGPLREARTFRSTEGGDALSALVSENQQRHTCLAVYLDIRGRASFMVLKHQRSPRSAGTLSEKLSRGPFVLFSSS